MKQTLIIGSTTVDIIIRIPHLPTSTEDLNTSRHQYSLGGCAYNISHIFHLFQLPYLLCTPQGTGIYGEYVKQQLKQKGVTLPIQVKEESGACICLVEENGERCFLANHGVEYTFHKEWMQTIDLSNVNHVYVCGLEIEETSGQEIIDFLKEHPEMQIFFAPGPRINSIDPKQLEQLFALSCIVHLNEQEILSYSKHETLEQACEYLYKKTQNDIIVTLGGKGAYYYHENQGVYIEGYPATVKDTIGAGDSHLGTYMACCQMGYDALESIRIANKVASYVVSIEGASLTEEEFKQIER
ncbi:MAG: PfkB family carbohydrate kinase [Erysipelotrichaceae bacterium]|nr:PfkB family carbohydrate kinase [Erysipelotrichaceae bacterium]